MMNEVYEDRIIFSIIIPCFNTKTADFIRCLESIKNNDLDKNKFEVIIINDGMKDFNEYDKIIEKVLTSNNIKNSVMHNSLNMRQGYSRYVGLKVAKGDYVHFVDSDDEIFHHTYTTLINYLKDEPNFIIFKEESIIAEVDNFQQDYIMDNLINGINKDILQDYIFSKKDTGLIRGGLNVVLHSKVFNRLWLLENTKLYLPNLYLEDSLLTFEYLLKTEKFKVCLEKLYIYNYYNEGSTVGSVETNNKLFFDGLFVFDKIFNMIQSEDRLDLRHLFLDHFLGFYKSYDAFFMKGKFDFFFLEIIKKYEIISCHFINKKHYQWFKKDEKLKKLFSQYILSKEDLFFSDSLGIGEETIIPQDKAEKGKKIVNKNFNLDESMPQLRRKYEALNNEGRVNNLDSVLESLILSTLIFTLTKFVYSKEIFITKLYRDNKKSTDLFERITFAYDVDTSIVCQNFLRDVKKYDMKVMEYRDYFQDCFKDYNDVIFPDFQFYYKKSGDDFRESEVPESNFTVIFDDYMMKIFYNGCCYSDDLVDLFFNSFKIVLDIFVNDELETLSNISLSNIFISSKNICKDDVGKEGLGKNYKNGFIPSSQTTVIKTFNEIVDNYEDKYALMAVDRGLTFNDLDLESNIIANELIKRGLRKGDKVLIVLNRDSKLISSIFGVIKAGGVFIIVSPDDPTHRINFIKDQTDTRFLISFKVFIDKILSYSKDSSPHTYFENNFEDHGNGFCNKHSKSNGTYCIDINRLINGEDERLPVVDLKSTDILCIVYTSGSTGSPKGVTLSHNSIPDINSLRSIFKLTNLNFGGDDKYLLDLGQNFTVAFFSELLIFLSYGVTIVLNNKKQLTDPRELLSLYERTKFNMMVTIPSKLNEYLELDQIKDLTKKLKMIVFLGEKHTPDLINRIKSLNKDISLVNVYGSSETFLSNIKLIDEYNQFIGKPVQFFNEMVADLDNNPLPQGIAGELLIGGNNLAENYYNDEELTKKKFIKIKDMSFFKTGELVKSVGEDFVLLGRLDNQIKLRGQRIDPGEIENNVPEDIGVEKAIVTINNKNNDQVLTLYFTTKSKSLMNDEIVKIKEIIKGHLVSVLPGFMVPQDYVYLEEFPKTSTGKVNVKDLKNHDDNIKEIVKPSTDLERELFDLSVDILGYDDFGVTNSLISIGFTSLSMIKLLNKILVEYKLYLIFEEAYNMNILEISKIIENKGSTYTNYELKDCYPLTSIQSNYYNFIKENFDSLLPNLCYVLTFKDIDVFKMKDALIKTIEINNYIKTSFIIVDDTVYQKRNDDMKLDIKIFNKKLTEKIEKKFLKPFDIFEPPLFRFELYYHNNKMNLLMDIHHIIADLLSIDIFILDLIKEYYSNSVDIKEYDYFDYTLDQVNINPIDKEKSKNYFLKQVANFPLGLYNNPKPINGEYTFNLKSIVLKDSFAIFLKKYKVSENDLFLSAVVICLTKFLNVNNILINFVFNGRDDSRSFDAFGYFARSIPLFLEVDDNICIKDFLNHLKDLKNLYINNSRYFNPEDLIKDYLISKRKVYIQYNYFGDIFDNRDNNYLDDSYSKRPIQYNSMLNEDDSYFFYFDKNVVKDFELYCGYVNAYNNGHEIDNLLKNIGEVVKLILDNPSMIMHDLFQLLDD